MKNTDSPKPNWPTCRPNKDNMLLPAGIKAKNDQNHIYPADFMALTACGSLLSAAEVSTDTKLNIATVVASGISKSQPLQNTAAINICTGTRNKKARFQNLFLVNQRDCLADCRGVASIVFAFVFFVKSCMRTCSNYWFKTYSFIISKSHHVLKAIMQVMVDLLLYMQRVCNLATPVNNCYRSVIKHLLLASVGAGQIARIEALQESAGSLRLRY